MNHDIADLLDAILPAPEREPWACPWCASLVREPHPDALPRLRGGPADGGERLEVTASTEPDAGLTSFRSAMDDRTEGPPLPPRVGGYAALLYRANHR